MEYVSERMGMSVGRMFIQDNFKRESKETVSTASTCLFRGAQGDWTLLERHHGDSHPL